MLSSVPGFEGRVPPYGAPSERGLRLLLREPDAILRHGNLPLRMSRLPEPQHLQVRLRSVSFTPSSIRMGGVRFLGFWGWGGVLACLVFLKLSILRRPLLPKGV